MTVYISRCANGGSISVSNTEQNKTYFIDHRTGSNTKGQVFYDVDEHRKVNRRDAHAVANELRDWTQRWATTIDARTKANYIELVSSTVEDAAHALESKYDEVYK